MGDLLSVGRNGFQAWLMQPRSARAMQDERLGAAVRARFGRSVRTHGARRVWNDVVVEGFECGRHGNDLF